MKTKNIGIGTESPKEGCNDKSCPFHGDIKVRGRSFVGKVMSTKRQKTCTVQWERSIDVPKYERQERRKTKISVHNPPCINAREGDEVKLYETRPISKTKSFVIVEVIKSKKENESS